MISQINLLNKLNCYQKLDVKIFSLLKLLAVEVNILIIIIYTDRFTFFRETSFTNIFKFNARKIKKFNIIKKKELKT
jgi:hypothetical protein